jgi:hypothetical protein
VSYVNQAAGGVYSLRSGHYHFERNHQGLDNALIDDKRGTTNLTGNIERDERLGGMLNYYYRRAA